MEQALSMARIVCRALEEKKGEKVTVFRHLKSFCNGRLFCHCKWKQ